MTLRCVDTSAWHRSGHPMVTARWRTLLDSDELGLCDQVRLEILYSARSAADYDALVEELDGLIPIPISGGTFPRALEVQQALAHVGGLHHRSVKIADLVIAAAAEAVEATVWHYDEDFDRIAALTGQPTEWVAPRGSL
jgi:predicted nucleic acid-binding protein